MSDGEWSDIGSADRLSERPTLEVVGRHRIVLTRVGDRIGAISATCNHIGGPLDQGSLDGEYLVCPWHYWAFHRETGVSRAGAGNAVPAHDVRVEGDRVLVSTEPRTGRARPTWTPHRLSRAVQREPGPIRVLGVSTTAMTSGHPRYSTSEDLLDHALRHAATSLGCDTTLRRMRDLQVRACEGFYSKAARACTWPCSITIMDPTDQMEQIYEGVVHWADVILVATPIRWGAPSSLYFKMIERMNCIQNQETIANKRLLQNKVAAFIITGGQDNVQAVAGQMLGFFAELGCQFPQFPYIAHSRGWSAEDMENNMAYVRDSTSLHDGACALVDRAVEMAGLFTRDTAPAQPVVRGGRKAHELDTHAQLGLTTREPK